MKVLKVVIPSYSHLSWFGEPKLIQLVTCSKFPSMSSVEYVLADLVNVPDQTGGKSIVVSGGHKVVK